MGRTHGTTDYSHEIQCEAVQCYLSLCSKDEKEYLRTTGRVRTKSGRAHGGERTTFQRAHEALANRAWSRQQDEDRVNAMSSRAFRDLVKRHAYSVLMNGNCSSKNQKNACWCSFQR